MHVCNECSLNQPLIESSIIEARKLKRIGVPTGL